MPNHAPVPDLQLGQTTLNCFLTHMFTGTADRLVVDNTEGRHIFWAEHDSKTGSDQYLLYNIQGVFLAPPKKLKFVKPRLGVSTLT